MFNPYENNLKNDQNNQNQTTDVDKEVKTPAAAGYGTSETPYTAQTGTTHESTEQKETPEKPAQTAGSVTYHTGPIHSGNAYFPNQSQPTNPYSANNGYAQQPQRTAYTWNPQSSAQPTQSMPYYTPAAATPPKPKKPRKKLTGKFAVKLAAVVLSCAVVSFSSVGVFALMIQNGVVNVENPTSANKTAAFTIYKQADDDNSVTPTVTGESKSAQEIAANLKKSVVCIQNYQITQQNSFFGYSYSNGDDSSLSPAGEGSGVIISKDGYIVTNQHVVDGATSLKVVTSEGLTYEAELIGEDTQTDLAVIKITTEDELTPAEFGSSEDLQVADEVMAIGNPGGMQLNSSVTFGRVSALNRQVENSETGYTIKCIQTDAAVNPGNSGGALVDMNGHVVGIVSSKIVATDYEGLGFAIPSDTAQPIVSDLIEFGYIKDRPMLGISGQYIDRLTASFYGMNAGYYIVQVNSENAKNAGLQRGDMITAIDDTQITSANTISTYIANKKPGDTVTLTVDRTAMGQQSVKVELVLSENTGLTQ